MNPHKSFIALEVFQWIGGAVIWIQLWHLESTQDRLLHNAMEERGVSNKLSQVLTLFLKVSKLVIDLVELVVILIEIFFGLALNGLLMDPS